MFAAAKVLAFQPLLGTPFKHNDLVSGDNDPLISGTDICGCTNGAITFDLSIAGSQFTLSSPPSAFSSFCLLLLLPSPPSAFSSSSLFLSTTSSHFVIDLFFPLVMGGRVQIVPSSLLSQIEQFVERISESGVSLMWVTPSVLRLLIDNCTLPSSLTSIQRKETEKENKRKRKRKRKQNKNKNKNKKKKKKKKRREEKKREKRIKEKRRKNR
jgi:hypothetical protein